ncbi:hypothetical protein IG631_20064 [Alternaria alternata]|nr:hypothetical protein IG631_20064 [Alternaria alternata]
MIGRVLQLRHLGSPVFVIKNLNLALWHLSTSINCSASFSIRLIKKMSSPPDAFSYQPLSEPSREKLETRLIYLHPGGFDECIYCTIYHANILERRPQTEYTALSYVWGNAKHKKPIQLGYHKISTSGTADTWPSASAPGACCYRLFQVTTNLEKALRHLRDRASGRILWVDAICINQSDEEEKLSQVQSMGDVYKNAVEVRVWLGSLKDVQEVIKEDTEFVLSCERRDIEMALLAAKNYVMDEDRPLGQEANDERFPNELQALGIHIIAMQPWWRRVWVIQEATLPKEDPIMQCGNMQVRYRKFLRMTKRCMFRDAPSILSQTQISLLVHGMFHADYVPSETSTASRILTYLSCMSGNFEVTEPQDRIYGVDGFTRMGDCHDNIFFLMTRDKHNLKDHYTFFHRITIWILFDARPQSYPLRILESGPNNIEGIPSWVPMWKSKKWSGENKTYGAPESRYDILAQGVSMGKRWHKSTISICARCTAEYKQKWGIPKSLHDIDVRCTEIKIRDALALGRVVTTLKILPVPERQDTDVLRKAILEVEEEILKALGLIDIPRADTKKPIRKFRKYLHINFWGVDRREGPSSSEHSATLEEFLRCKRKSKKRKGQRRSSKVSANQADLNVPEPSSIAKLSSFFAQSRDLVVGSEIVGHIFEDEDSPPCWQSGDKLYLIPECRWALGLRHNGSGYRYMYRVFISDLAWQQRKQMFDDKGVYESIVLI